MVSDSVSKKFGIDKSIGFGIKNRVSKKVLDSVSENFGIGKQFRIRFRSDFGYRHTLLLLICDGGGGGIKWGLWNHTAMQ